MAYRRVQWTDRSSQFPRRYRMIRDENDPDLVTMIPENGNVISEGTNLNAMNMNRMEDGIEQGVAAMNEVTKRVLTINGVRADQNGNVNVTPSGIGAAVIRFFSADFPASGWTEQEGGGYAQQVDVTGLRGNMNGHIDVDMSEVEASVAEDVMAGWAMVGRAESLDGALLLVTYSDVPVVDIRVKLEVIA